MTRSLEDVFQQFCNFGAKGAPPLMDGAKFAKLCKDMKLLDKNLSATDVDIIFAKSKPEYCEAVVPMTCQGRIQIFIRGGQSPAVLVSRASSLQHGEGRI